MLAFSGYRNFISVRFLNYSTKITENLPFFKWEFRISSQTACFNRKQHVHIVKNEISNFIQEYNWAKKCVLCSSCTLIWKYSNQEMKSAINSWQLNFCLSLKWTEIFLLNLVLWMFCWYYTMLHVTMHFE